MFAVVGERAEGIRGLARSGREGLSVEEDVVVTNGFELPVVVRAVGEEGEERMEERGYLGVFPELSVSLCLLSLCLLGRGRGRERGGLERMKKVLTL